jgi:uncharacterized protein (TIGR02246 family)
MHLLAFAIVAGAILAPAVASAAPVSAADANAIRAVIERQADAWNRHDMDAFVADTTPDVDWINIVGMHWEGREAVRQAHAALHKTMFAHSRLLLTDSLELRQIAPDVIIAVSVRRIEGAAPTPSGQPYPDGGNILTLVFVKTADGWRIVHAHNTPIDRDAARYDPAKAP